MDSFERSARSRGYRVIAGVDEAGRGPLAGPVVAAAVVLHEEFRLDGVRDSKQLSGKKRQRFYDIILNGALSWGLGVVEPSVIDRINVLQATRLAMKEAVLQLSPAADYLLIDGTRAQRLQLPVTQETIVRGMPSASPWPAPRSWRRCPATGSWRSTTTSFHSTTSSRTRDTVPGITWRRSDAMGPARSTGGASRG